MAGESQSFAQRISWEPGSQAWAPQLGGAVAGLAALEVFGPATPPALAPTPACQFFGHLFSVAG